MNIVLRNHKVFMKKNLGKYSKQINNPDSYLFKKGIAKTVSF